MLKGIPGHHRMLTVAEGAGELVPTMPSSRGQRMVEMIPALVSWLILLAPLWLTLIAPGLGFVLVSAFVAYFVCRGLLYGIRALLRWPRIQAGMRTDWRAKLEQEGAGLDIDWRDCRVTFLIRAFREGNLEMLRDTVASIYASNWPKVGGLLRGVDVVFATEEDDPITPPLIEVLAAEFRDKVPVRQIRHPHEPGTLPGPSTAMHYVGRILYRQAVQRGVPPHLWLVSDLDSDTIVHPQYVACLVHHYVRDPQRGLRVFQPAVAFTTDYWQAPLHSRLSAAGNTGLTVSWNRRPEIAFTGAAASLALLRSVDFWPTNSHSQDSGLDLRLRMRYGRRYRVVGMPVPMHVYPVMAIGEGGPVARVRAYLDSVRALFRQSARWREGPLDEFVEALQRGHLPSVAHRLWIGLERDTVTIVPGFGYLAARGVIGHFHQNWQLGLPGGGNEILGIAGMVALSLVSALGLVVFWHLLQPGGRFVPPASRQRRVLELLAFWLVFGLYVPVFTGIAGLKTATLYLLGRRPRGHFAPTPK